MIMKTFYAKRAITEDSFEVENVAVPDLHERQQLTDWALLW